MPSSTGKIPMKDGLEAAIDTFRTILGDSQDFITKQLETPWNRNAALLYMNGITDRQLLQQSVQEIMDGVQPSEESSGKPDTLLVNISKKIHTAGDVKLDHTMEGLLSNLLCGYGVFLLEGCNEALAFHVEGGEGRAVEEPTSQGVTRGPMEGFNESLATNLSMIRRRIKDPRLWAKGRKIGKITQTNVVVLYIHELACPELVEEVFRRLDKIDTDSILESGYIEEFIQDEPYSPFPTLYNTERPDVIAASLMEGKIAILVDGTPFALLAPALFVQFFQSPEDYYQRADISTLLRLIRFLAFLITMLAPSFYIAITTFHQEMLPTSLLVSLAAQREGVPFPAFIEAMLMEITFEILREAAVRMPKTVGQAISIVGTLVIGQAAVDAGIVSAAMVIIVSITAVSSFVIPAINLSIAIRMIRFLLMGLAATFGLFGMMTGLIVLILHLTGLRTFGVPYMTSVAPFVFENQKDTLFRIPWRGMVLRPKYSGGKNLKRQQKSPQRKQEEGTS